MKCLFKPLIIIVSIAVPVLSVAEVYRWVDDKGVTHFGDKPPAKTKSGASPSAVAKVNLRGDKIFNQVKQKTPLKYQAKDKAALVLFKELQVKLKKSNRKDLHIGTRTQSNRGSCGNPQPIMWDQGFIDVSESSLMSDVIVAFKEENYRMITGKLMSVSNSSRLTLNATISKLRIDVCNSYNQGTSSYQKAAAYVKVSWRLVDRLSRKVLHNNITEGAVNEFDRFRRNGAEKAIFRAITMAARNLLADENFVDHLTPLPGQNVPAQTFARLDVALRYGNAKSTFKSEIEKLKSVAVTVRTVNGHGSGVILDKAGYVLTNAHVVGESSDVIVLINNQALPGKVIRREPYRDVALIEVKNLPAVKSVAISKAKLTEGDTIYVIGTPLDESLSNTVTKGVFSAFRKHDGLIYYQTDAAINPGNSGGPVFDDKGELIAISVAGVFTRDGASLNVNYLVPIEDAIKKLNITEARDMSHLFDVSDDIEKSKVEGKNKTK